MGQQLDGDDVPVAAMDAGMDQEGRIIAVLIKGNVSTGVGKLYAVRGVPGAVGQAPQWSTAVRLDTDAIPFKLPTIIKQNKDNNNLAVAVSRNGNAHAVWGNVGQCGARYPSYRYGCYYIYSSFYDVSADKWSEPLLVSEISDESPSYPINVKPKPYVNDRGDVAVQYRWHNQVTPVDADKAVDSRTAVAWRAAGQAAFQKRAFSDALYGFQAKTVLDSTGGMVFAGEKAQYNNSNKDIYTYTGNVASGFAATTGDVVDTLTSDSALGDLAVGPTGDILLTWTQNDGSMDKIFGASKASAASAWSAPVAFSPNYIPLILAPSVGAGVGIVNDSGDAVYYATDYAIRDSVNGVGCTVYIRPKATGIWAAMTPAIPIGCGVPKMTWREVFSTLGGFSGDGSFLYYETPTGKWKAYNQPSNTMTSADYLLGFDEERGVNNNLVKVMYAKKADGNYVGAVLRVDDYDTLPTPTAKFGIGRPGINNLWGFYLK